SRPAGAAAIAVIAALSCLQPSPSIAGPDVGLVSLDGSTTIEGELIDYDGKVYTLRTAVGVVKIDAAQVTCDGEGCPGQGGAGGQFDITGSNVIGDGLMPALIEGYGDALDAIVLREVGAGINEHIYRVVDDAGSEIATIGVSAHGTATAYPALADGSAAIGIASSQMAGNEQGVTDMRGSAEEQILALDGLIAIVHPDNPVRILTIDQIAAIFAGRIVNWGEVGGRDQVINLYTPDQSSGTLEVFNRLVLAPRRLELADTAEQLGDHADLSDLVSIDPSGIGFTSFAFQRGAQAVAIRQPCGLISPPTTFAIKTEEYPLGRRLYTYAPDAAQTPRSRGFIDFTLSNAAQPIIGDAGFVDRSIETESIEVQGGRLANSVTAEGDFSLPVFREMLGELRGGARLSITFRFNEGSSNLERRSQSEAERFAQLLAQGVYRGKDILLVGFTDSVGDFNVNRGLAERRAHRVLETFNASVEAGALDTVPILAQSYGELTPVGCNDTPQGRDLNRRVEVWIRDTRN
ncbi:MAG: phosphate ABC transporter substrate-binding/OmpA family protein, partial [Paracoccaceae bacterium]|nr:phosphate ABC transporter substrate-binding/OmpA family protein [Paracoccaceae bacterium]